MIDKALKSFPLANRLMDLGEKDGMTDHQVMIASLAAACCAFMRINNNIRERQPELADEALAACVNIGKWINAIPDEGETNA